jgi:hypothetical protein
MPRTFINRPRINPRPPHLISNPSYTKYHPEFSKISGGGSPQTKPETYPLNLGTLFASQRIKVDWGLER